MIIIEIPTEYEALCLDYIDDNHGESIYTWIQWRIIF